MEAEMIELKQKIEALTNENAELKSCKQEYLSAKQSLNRMSARLRKVCKRLTPTTDVVAEMQAIADEIRDYAKKVT